jgi:hypothetical protein
MQTTLKVFFIAALSLGFSFNLHAQSFSEVREGAERPELFPRNFIFDGIDVDQLNLAKYKHFDVELLQSRPIRQLFKFYEINYNNIRNKKYVTFIDFNYHSSQQRMWVINMQDGSYRSFWVSHGVGSDPEGDGYAQSFSNVPNSKASSIGFYTTGSLYNGSNGTSMYLHGLQKTNSNAYERAVVMHGAEYVQPGQVAMSWGCPAINHQYIPELLPVLKEGTVLYIYYNQP